VLGGLLDRGDLRAPLLEREVLEAGLAGRGSPRSRARTSWRSARGSVKIAPGTRPRRRAYPKRSRILSLSREVCPRKVTTVGRGALRPGRFPKLSLRTREISAGGGGGGGKTLDASTLTLARKAANSLSFSASRVCLCSANS
jgi:hypothetical protein